MPNLELPPYSYVPGLWPHPFSDPAGHHFAIGEPTPLDGEGCDCLPYRAGIDLFNLGYYWEAHEAWERLWHAAGRQGSLADFFKALIQLAVVGVKFRESRPDGVRTHAARAAELFASLETVKRIWWGLDVADLVRRAAEAGTGEVMAPDEPRPPVQRVFAWYLHPQFDERPASSSG
jgi:hypothetical protein